MNVKELERGITAAHTNGDTRTLERLQAEYRKFATTRVSGPNSIVIVERSQTSVAADSAPTVAENGSTTRTVVRPEARHAVRNLGLTPERESGMWLVGHQDRDVITIETVWPGRPGSSGFEGEARKFKFDASWLGVVDERAHRAGWRVVGDAHSHPVPYTGAQAAPTSTAGAAKRRGYVGLTSASCFAPTKPTCSRTPTASGGRNGQPTSRLRTGHSGRPPSSSSSARTVTDGRQEDTEAAGRHALHVGYGCSPWRPALRSGTAPSGRRRACQS